MNKTDHQRINHAMLSLEAKGYEIAMGSWCCSTCTTADFDTDKFVYYHQQDTEHLVNGNIPRGDIFYIGWGEDGDLDEICAAFEEQKFIVEKPESTAIRIGLR
jgi:hypothetical protein